MEAAFDEFVRARSGRLMRLAVLLAQDHALAEDLLQTALARAWPAWRRIHGDPEPYVRRVMVNTYNSWWRRKWNGERPVAMPPDRQGHWPQGGVDARDEVWRALARLPRQQRAVLVLRYFEDLSEAEIADVLSISAGAVKNYASKGLAKLRLDPSLLSGSPEPVAVERVAAVRARIRRRRRNQMAALAGVLVVVLVLTALAFARPRRTEPVDPPPPIKSVGSKQVVAMLPFTEVDALPVTLTWTDVSLVPTFVYVDCRLPGAVPPHHFVRVTVNGQWDLEGMTCERPLRDDEPIRLDGAVDLLSRQNLQEALIREGGQVTLTVRIDGPAENPAEGRVAVVLAQYPEPHAVPAFPAGLGGIWLDSGGQQETAVPWQGDLQVNLLTKLTGRYWVTANGVRLALCPERGGKWHVGAAL